jgi:Family of unknown function (DUF5681)
MTDIKSDQKMPGRDTRWKKGDPSPNPDGRPKSRAMIARSDFGILEDMRFKVTKGGETREATAQEALFIKTFQLAMAGNRIAIRIILKAIVAREEALAKQHSKQPGLPMLFQREDPDNAVNALCHLGLAEPDTRYEDYGDGRRLVLKPEGVQMALKRRGLGRLTSQDVSNINLVTLAADTLIWPKGSET